MTEAKWFESAEPQSMLECLKVKASDRKLRLFAVACGRRVWHLLTDMGKENLLCAERFADGNATPVELKSADDGSFWHGQGLHYNLESEDIQTAFFASFLCVRGDFAGAAAEVSRALGKSDGIAQTQFVRD